MSPIMSGIVASARAVVASGPSTVNLISNGGAESTDLTGWAAIRSTNIPAKSGTYSWSGYYNDNYDNLTQYSANNVLTPGNTYSLSFWVTSGSSSVPDTGEFTLFLGTSQYSVVVPVIPTNNVFTKVVLENKLCTGNGNIVFNTGLYGAPTRFATYIDDVWLQRNPVAH